MGGKGNMWCDVLDDSVGSANSAVSFSSAFPSYYYCMYVCMHTHSLIGD